MFETLDAGDTVAGSPYAISATLSPAAALANYNVTYNTASFTIDQAVEKLVTGGDVSPAEVLTAVQKADLAFRMMMQIRNKIMAAYDEVKQIRV